MSDFISSNYFQKVATSFKNLWPREDPSISTKKLIVTGLISLLSLGASYHLFKLLMDQILDPNHKENEESRRQARELLLRIGVEPTCLNQLSAMELCMARDLVLPSSISTSWEEIGGMEDVIRDIRQTVILPFRRPDLFPNSNLFRAPKGVLLYGPPGCGKTMIAKAIARDAGARFINLQVNNIVDKWYGESEKRAAAIFSLATKLQPTILFIDEIDSFLRARAIHDNETTALIKTQFMMFWDGLNTNANTRIMIIGATNRPRQVDAAILRRMPLQIPINKPNKKQLVDILKKTLASEEVHTEVYRNIDSLAERCAGMSGSDIRELCREAAVLHMQTVLDKHDFDENMVLQVGERELRICDFENALQKQLVGRVDLVNDSGLFESVVLD
jgi:ATPase family AAA domain-containing protein 1